MPDLKDPHPNCVLGCGYESRFAPVWVHADACPSLDLNDRLLSTREGRSEFFKAWKEDSERDILEFAEYVREAAVQKIEARASVIIGPEPSALTVLDPAYLGACGEAVIFIRAMDLKGLFQRFKERKVPDGDAEDELGVSTGAAQHEK